mmetsp:Transcript_26575/g.32229  ORF Transcript_26575/g.32229 Transcript_26575/m.32229 type:complete len:391 (+) Transcript_26575:288-1460(+)|eukprot:CAMPEP_0197844916 /NCGR_PEP_ID=MMETSP1438-20131217/1895_1 /TAXON_ID=1461541 /ORGANISM="Pterosperma sp., Strain CCMP1384" /LENGTH=390 /DNA_ID=CAMNT_0043455957 /DNA_START=272 /DNA_END=1444 /DNA_ORIENTATION=+
MSKEAVQKASEVKGKVTLLTYLRAYGYFACCLTWITAITFFGLLLLVFPCVLMVRPFSRRWYYTFVNIIMGTFYMACFMVSEVGPGIKVHVTGDELVPGENVLLLSNHKSNVDYMYIWSLFARRDIPNCNASVGTFRAIAKRELRNLWIWSMGFKSMGFCFLSREWSTDEAHIVKWLGAIKKDNLPCQIVLYPEGTRYTDAKKPNSDEYARRMGYRPYENELLFPRTKGLVLLYREAREYIPCVLDMTVVYTKNDEILKGSLLGTKALWAVLMGNIIAPGLTDVHIHIHRHPIDQIPDESEKLTRWCMDVWDDKDKLLSHLKQTGSFPGSPIPVDEAHIRRTTIISAGLLTVVAVYGSWMFLIYTKFMFGYTVMCMVAGQMMLVKDDPEF